MPKVKYLKDLCSGRAGSVQDLQDYEANVLIRLGVVQLVDENEAAKKAESDCLVGEATKAAHEAAEKAYEHIPPNILLNLNGRPVVGDYGDMVEEPKKKGSKATK